MAVASPALPDAPPHSPAQLADPDLAPADAAQADPPFERDGGRWEGWADDADDLTPDEIDPALPHALLARLPLKKVRRVLQRHELAGGVTLHLRRTDEDGGGDPVVVDRQVLARVGGPAPFARLAAIAVANATASQDRLADRAAELHALQAISRLAAEEPDLEAALQRIVELVAEVMDVRASSIRLLDPASGELHIAAVHDLSDDYQGKGRILLADTEIDRRALGEAGYAVVDDLAEDPRVLFPEQARAEGVVSALVAGMTYRGERVGLIRVYTGRPHRFARREIDLLRAVAGMAASAIVNVRLREESRQAERMEQQLKVAAMVQQRMLPQAVPELPGMTLAGIYLPAMELAGDLYDYIPLPEGNLGLLVADVSGKGVAAALIGSLVRGSLRAQLDHVYDLSDAMAGVNHMLCRDTQPGEFVTLFYGVLDTAKRRLTFCSAGHPPALLWRDGGIGHLTTHNMLLGVDEDATFDQGVIDLLPGDRLLLYTDGLPDAADDRERQFTEARVEQSYRRAAAEATSAGDVLCRVRADVRAFTGLTPQVDDITAVALNVG